MCAWLHVCMFVCVCVCVYSMFLGITSMSPSFSQPVHVLMVSSFGVVYGTHVKLVKKKRKEKISLTRQIWELWGKTFTDSRLLVQNSHRCFHIWKKIQGQTLANACKCLIIRWFYCKPGWGGRLESSCLKFKAKCMRHACSWGKALACLLLTYCFYMFVLEDINGLEWGFRK